MLCLRGNHCLPAQCAAFKAIESVLVGRTSATFEHILRCFQKRLSLYGADAAHIRYFVSDMSISFANAVMMVFNEMNLPEYFSILRFAAKDGNTAIASRSMRTRLAWCSVHRDRAMSKHAKEAFKKVHFSTQRDMMMLFRNIRMAIIASKRYFDLCQLNGFLDMFASMSELCAPLTNSTGVVKEQAGSQALLKRGERLIWKHIGGVP